MARFEELAISTAHDGAGEFDYAGQSVPDVIAGVQLDLIAFDSATGDDVFVIVQTRAVGVDAIALDVSISDRKGDASSPARFVVHLPPKGGGSDGPTSSSPAPAP